MHQDSNRKNCTRLQCRPTPLKDNLINRLIIVAKKSLNATSFLRRG